MCHGIPTRSHLELVSRLIGASLAAASASLAEAEQRAALPAHETSSPSSPPFKKKWSTSAAPASIIAVTDGGGGSEEEAAAEGRRRDAKPPEDAPFVLVEPIDLEVVLLWHIRIRSLHH